MMMPTKCISKLGQLSPPKFARSWSAKCLSPNSLDHGLLVYLHTRSITASKFAQSWPPSASPYSLDHDLRVHLSVHSITASKCISKYTRLPPQTRSIMAQECICEFRRSSFSGAPRICSQLPACCQSRYTV